MMPLVLIVAKCNVNYFVDTSVLTEQEVLIVAKCNVNDPNSRIICPFDTGINSSKV